MTRLGGRIVEHKSERQMILILLQVQDDVIYWAQVYQTHACEAVKSLVCDMLH